MYHGKSKERNGLAQKLMKKLLSVNTREGKKHWTAVVFAARPGWFLFYFIIFYR